MDVIRSDNYGSKKKGAIALYGMCENVWSSIHICKLSNVKIYVMPITVGIIVLHLIQNDDSTMRVSVM